MEGDNLAPNGKGRVKCRTCVRERNGSIGPAMKDRTHCPSGHPYDDENTRTRTSKGKTFRVCITCERARQKAAKRAKADADPLYHRGLWLKYAYGMTLDQYDELLESQGGVCAACRGTCSKEYLSVDHDHETGEVRGLLCSTCNLALGYVKDSVDLMRSLIAYLEGKVPSPG